MMFHRTVSRGFARALFTAAALTTLLATSGCILPTSEENREKLAETNDPLEPMNRYFFDVNIFLLEFVLKPASAMYQAALPDPAQNGIHKLLANMHLPWTAVNDVLQGNFNRAGTALTRFGINTTIGVVGIFDVATGWGFPDHQEDFGQTLAAWGVPEMFYLVLPVFGPSNPRDAIGMAVDRYYDPVNFLVTNYVPKGQRTRDPDGPAEALWFPTARGLIEGIDEVARNRQAIDDLQRQSLDFYATVRSVWRQRRQAEIENRGSDDSSRSPMTLAPAPFDARDPQVQALLPQPPAPPRRAGFTPLAQPTAASE